MNIELKEKNIDEVLKSTCRDCELYKLSKHACIKGIS
jgi:hypothetical protein